MNKREKKKFLFVDYSATLALLYFIEVPKAMVVMV